jgi:N-acetylneuraminate lyase
MKTGMSSLRSINGRRLTGLIAATFTPLKANQEIDAERIPEVVDYLIDHGIAGMYVLGSTGEGVSVTVEQRHEVAESFVQAADRRLPVILQVGSESLAQARQLAAHAQKIGADAISAVPPLYFKPESVEILVEAMAEIAAGAPQLPFYYYHIPAVTGVTHSMLDFLRLGGAEIPTLAGIKYTSTDVDQFAACVEFAGDEFQLLWGVDELLCDGLSAGAKAAVGSTYNYAAPIHQHLFSAYAKGDHEQARALQQPVQSIVDAFVPFGPRAAQKAIMSMVGLDCGPCRLPLKTLSRENSAALQQKLTTIGFFDNLKKYDVREVSAG